MWFHELLPMELFTGEGLDAAKVSLDGKVQPVDDGKSGQDAKQKADAGKERSEPGRKRGRE